MTEQIVFLAALYLTGLLFCLSLRAELNIHMINLLSLPAGMAVWVVCSLFIVMSTLPIRLLTLGLCIVGLYVLSVWLTKRQFGDYWWKEMQRRDAVATGIWVSLAFVIFIYAGLTFPRIGLTTDSLFYEGLGRVLFQFGEIDGGSPTVFANAMHIRMAFIPLLHAAARLFGIDFLVTLYPVTALWFLLLFMSLCWEASGHIAGIGKMDRMLAVTVAGLLLITLPIYKAMAAWLHSNLMTSLYYSVALISLFLWDGEQKAWLVVSAITLAMSVLIRKEMAAFAVIPVLLLAADRRCDPSVSLKVYLALYLPLAFSWPVYGFWPAGFDLIGPTGLLSPRGGFAVYLIMLIATLVCSIPFMYSRFLRHYRTLLPVAAIGVLTLTLFASAFAFPAASKTAILLKVMGPRGKWGITWYVMLGGLAVLYPLADKHRRREHSYVLILFFLIRILMYTLFDQPKDYGWITSGNRIVLHVWPFALFSYLQFFLSAGGQIGAALSWKKESCAR